MSMFAGIENTKAAVEGVSQYFEEGKYRVQIDNTFIHRKRLGGHLFIVETTVLESSNPEVLPGETRNWVQSFEFESAMARIKTFIGAAKGFCPRRQLTEINREITQSVCDDVVSGSNPLKGVALDLECVTKRSKKTDKDFNVHMWFPAVAGDTLGQKRAHHQQTVPN